MDKKIWIGFGLGINLGCLRQSQQFQQTHIVENPPNILWMGLMLQKSHSSEGGKRGNQLSGKVYLGCTLLNY